MDYLLTAIAIALVCLAAWLVYKRWVGRYRQHPAEETEEDEEPEPEVVQKAVAEPPQPAPEAEEKKDA